MSKFKFWDEHYVPPLTKEQLIRRGSCCALGCTNCPYTKPRVKGNEVLDN